MPILIRLELTLKYLTYYIVIKREDLTEEVFKEIYRIFTDSINIDNKEKDNSIDYR
jgi:hypothetical protein